MYLISYDIEGNSLRTKIADKLIAEGLQRVQYSVFLGVVAPADFKIFRKWLEDALAKGNLQKDTILIIQLNKNQVQDAIIIGKGTFSKDEITDNINSLIF
jgi:CRISPR-associated endonuclease Cas2